MSLKNLMEEKQLDFNQPLLSVRKFSSTFSTGEADNRRKNDNAIPRVPPVYKSELRSGPVRNPGTVPFVWEQSPGRPKYETKIQTIDCEQHPATPRLPPGRTSYADKQVLDKVVEGTAVRQSERRYGLSGSCNVTYLDESDIKEESSREETEEINVSGSEDEDEAYVDAVDTISRSESFFLNCSVSCVSGLDGPDVKPSNTFLTDLQTRDFMMGRFLPAAKAMASETPQYSTRKQPVAQEHPRETNKLSTVEKKYPSCEGRRPGNIPYCPHCNGIEETEYEDADYDGLYNSSLKVCGLFPRLCLQNSFCLLNPVPGMRKQIPATMFASHMTTAKPSSAVCCAEAVNEGNGSSPCHHKISHRDINEGKVFLGIPERSKDSGASGFSAKGGKPFRDLLAKESIDWELASASPLVEKTLYIDSAHMLKSQISNSNSNSADIIKGLSKSRRDDVSKNGEVEEKAFMDSSFQDKEHAIALSESLESADSGLFSLSDKSMHDMKIVLMDSPKHDQHFTGSSITPASTEVDEDENIDAGSKLGKISGNIESYLGLTQVPIKMRRAKVADNEKVNLESQFTKKLSDQEAPKGSYSLLPLPPPLPKSPSESWLKRALPAVSSKHTASKSSLGMNVYPRSQASETNSSDTKWETIVKTTKPQHGHLRFSEELLTPIPEV